jgi:1-acyl-sn-glycerol-3-phosphate acyltransferase
MSSEKKRRGPKGTPRPRAPRPIETHPYSDSREHEAVGGIVDDDAPISAPPSEPPAKVRPPTLASSPLPTATGAPATLTRTPNASPRRPRSDAPPPPMPDDSSASIDGAAVAARIRELEARLDRMIDESARAHEHPRVPPPPPSSARILPEGEPTVFDTARELLSTDFYLRKWGRLGMRNRSDEVDDFGFDPIYAKKVQPVFDFLYEKYFRVEVAGLEHVPSEGRCLLVANHSGTLPYDGIMMKLAVKRGHPASRDVRWLAEDFIFHFPFLGSFSNRIGAVRACQENAERLLRKEALVAVFPEGVKGIGKLFKERYQLQRFGRGGFIKLCLRTGTPIVPVAVIGAEEANPMIGRIEYLSKAIGFPYIPVTPTFPLLGPLGLVPAPTKWKITFGERLDLDYGPEAAEDEILVGRLAEQVRATIQGMLDRGVGERRSVFFG